VLENHSAAFLAAMDAEAERAFAAEGLLLGDSSFFYSSSMGGTLSDFF